MLVRFVHPIMCPMTNRCPTLPTDAIESIWHDTADRALLQAARETDPIYMRAALRTAYSNRALAAGSQRRRAMVST